MSCKSDKYAVPVPHPSLVTKILPLLVEHAKESCFASTCCDVVQSGHHAQETTISQSDNPSVPSISFVREKIVKRGLVSICNATLVFNSRQGLMHKISLFALFFKLESCYHELSNTTSASFSLCLATSLYFRWTASRCRICGP